MIDIVSNRSLRRRTPDRKIPGEQETSLLRSSPMESRNYIYSFGTSRAIQPYSNMHER